MSQRTVQCHNLHIPLHSLRPKTQSTITVYTLHSLCLKTQSIITPWHTMPCVYTHSQTSQFRRWHTPIHVYKKKVQCHNLHTPLPVSQDTVQCHNVHTPLLVSQDTVQCHSLQEGTLCCSCPKTQPNTTVNLHSSPRVPKHGPTSQFTRRHTLFFVSQPQHAHAPAQLAAAVG